MKKKRTALRPRISHGDFHRPALPANLIVPAHGVPRLAPALLQKLDRNLATSPAGTGGGRGRHSPATAAAAKGKAEGALRGRRGVSGRVALGLELAHEGGDALVDEGLDLGVGDVGELEAQDVAGLGEDGWEVAEEEDRVEDSWEERVLGLASAIASGRWVVD